MSNDYLSLIFILIIFFKVLLVPIDTELHELSTLLTGDSEAPPLAFSLASHSAVSLAPTLSLRSIAADLRTPMPILDLQYRSESPKADAKPIEPRKGEHGSAVFRLFAEAGGLTHLIALASTRLSQSANVRNRLLLFIINYSSLKTGILAEGSRMAGVAHAAEGNAFASWLLLHLCLH